MADKTKYKSVAIDNNCYKKIEELTTELTPGIKLSRAEVVRFLVNNFKFVEIRGEVIGEITGQEARENIDKLSKKYWDKLYPFPIQTERVVLIVKPNKEVLFNLKDEDFQ